MLLADLGLNCLQQSPLVLIQTNFQFFLDPFHLTLLLEDGFHAVDKAIDRLLLLQAQRTQGSVCLVGGSGCPSGSLIGLEYVLMILEQFILIILE